MYVLPDICLDIFVGAGARQHRMMNILTWKGKDSDSKAWLTSPPSSLLCFPSTIIKSKFQFAFWKSNIRKVFN